MPLVSILPYMKQAQAKGYAIPLYDTSDMAGTDGMVRAFEEKKAPGIVGLYSRLLEAPNAAALAAYCRQLCEESPVPLSLMLDHGSSFENCIKALRLGFTDVMIDHSSLPIEENIAITKMVVRAAHAVGAGAEAELGHVGSGQEYMEFGAQRKGFTDPASVERFVAETGVDMLAIAIGTAHGLYRGDPTVDLNLLDEIRRRVDIPLVLHGGTGLSEAQFRGAIGKGIAKINVATDLFVTSAKRMVAQAQQDPNTNYHAFARIPFETFKERCGYYLDLFGTSGQA